MEPKKDTPIHRARRKYEEANKEERKKASGQFNTRLPRKDYDEICAFLKEQHIRKIDLIYAGYAALQENIKQDSEKNKA